jgi:hypothetical protein
MILYPLLLFLHMVAVVGLFMDLLIELASLMRKPDKLTILSLSQRSPQQLLFCSVFSSS